MFLLSDDTTVTSASDLTLASACEFAFLRKLDQLHGRIAKLDIVTDELLARTAQLGDQHEERVLESYRAEFGNGVAEFVRPSPLTRESMTEAAALSESAFADRVDVVFQATMFEDDPSTHTAFVGFADFITRQPDGSYRVEDSKLARSEKVTAVLQLAAYADQLARRGIAVDDTVTLLLGDGTRSHHLVDDILPVYRLRRKRLLELISLRELEGRDGAPVAWGDRRFSICGACDHCTSEIDIRRDVLLVANLRRTQRDRLADAGIVTIDQLAASAGPLDGVGARTLDGLRRQAALQCAAEKGEPPPFELIDATAIRNLPQPDAGDIFFDFEGDPLYTESGGQVWGLDYLFGLIEADGTFRAFWSHNFAEEGRALRSFLDYVVARRMRYPTLHIYHYASYERTHLAQLAIRHGYGEEIVDDLFRQHVLVDLYPVVRASVRVGSPSYSIKKLEPLYMGDDLRDDTGVTNAGDSIVEYARAVERRASGDTAGFDETLRAIADYNEYDCRSTLRLRDWLRARVEFTGRDSGEDAASVEPAAPRVPSDAAIQAAQLIEQLNGHAGDPHELSEDPDRMAAALAAAAIGYHPREDKKAYWEHFGRLLAPLDEWVDSRGVFEATKVDIERDWYKEGRQRNERRLLRLTGRAAPGSQFKPDDTRKNCHLVYEVDSDAPVPDDADANARIAIEARIAAVAPDELLVEEVLGNGQERYASLPIAVTPGRPLDTKPQQSALREWASQMLETLPSWPQDPVADLLRRRPPNMATGTLTPAAELDALQLAASLRLVDRSYLAVQGPPGTGKTHVGAHAIAELLRDGWRIGVTAQSHAVIDNFLAGVVKASVDPDVVAHVAGEGGTPYAAIASKEVAAWADAQPAGYVVGATGWAFSNDSQIGRRQLDLLVIDEAGQFSLANTIAVSVSAQRLLLLGDPQQLPQVSQGVHPQPVDESALGWIAGGASVLPTERGYFLPLTRRMHSVLTTHVSQLSYRRALRSHQWTDARHLADVAPGLHPLPVIHEGNSVMSEQEAAALVNLVRSVVGKGWTDPQTGRANDPLKPSDIIVVTPYNAQRELIQAALVDAGISGVQVGTVDKFQGKEAVVSIVSLAASDASEVPRGMEFLINRNRLNVAISRAQWASWVVHSPALTAHLPTTVSGLKELSAFVRLIDI